MLDNLKRILLFLLQILIITCFVLVGNGNLKVWQVPIVLFGAFALMEVWGRSKYGGWIG